MYNCFAVECCCMKFCIYRSTRLGNLFAPDGNTDLSNSMASYMADQKVFVVKTFNSSGGSCVAVYPSKWKCASSENHVTFETHGLSSSSAPYSLAKA
jgi:hypothetical protein